MTAQIDQQLEMWGSMAQPPMKTRRVALILLILGGVLFVAEVRLYDSGRMRKHERVTPSLWAPPPPIRDVEETPMKFVDPPMPAPPPGPTPLERDRRR